jgi:hypothetical protein
LPPYFLRQLPAVRTFPAAARPFFVAPNFLLPFTSPLTLLLFDTPYSCGSGSPVGIATAYGLDRPGFESRWGARFFAHVQTGPRAHPASCIVGTRSFSGVKRPGRGADHPPPPSAEVENE